MSAVVFVVGPTACGKSELALELARRFGGGILNCDSLQVYRRLDIGTAKPSREDMAAVPHFMFDVLGPGEVLTAGDYRRMALTELAEHIRAGPVFAVGGSGFYIQALEKGMFEIEKAPVEVENEIRGRLEREGLVKLYRELERVDVETARELSPNDAYRIVRALVVFHGSGRRMSDLKKSFTPEPLPYPYIKLGLNVERDALLPRIERRTARMLAGGLMEEVRALCAEGFGSWPALQSVGYRECLGFLRGDLAADRVQTKIVESTAQLAKKQRTWFKRDVSIRWLNGKNPVPDAIECVTQFLAGVPAKA